MPTYQYECEQCQHSFEALQSMSEPKLKTCPSCNEDRLIRLIGSGSGIIFKGSGFYETDYKKKDAPKEAKSKPKTDSCGPAEKPAASSDSTKPAGAGA